MRLISPNTNLHLGNSLLTALLGSASLMALATTFALTLFSTAAFAGTPANSCPAVIQGKTLGCTTAAITLADVDVVSDQINNCVVGSLFPRNLELHFTANKNATVYDVGVWFAQDGLHIEDPLGAVDCISKPISFDIDGDVSPFPQVTSSESPISGPSPALDGDQCADTLSGNKGVAFTDNFGGVLLRCDAALGGAPLEAVVGWKSSAGGALCGPGVDAEKIDLAAFGTAQCSLNETQVIPFDIIGQLTIQKSSTVAADPAFAFTSSGGCTPGELEVAADDLCTTEITAFNKKNSESELMEAFLGDEIIVTETDTSKLVSIVCTNDGTANPANATISGGEVKVTLTGAQPSVTCVYTNSDTSPPTGAVTVEKKFTDNSTTKVNVYLSCTNGAAAQVSPLQAQDGGDNAVFTVNLPNPGAVCTATEDVPDGYTGNVSACTSLDPTASDGTEKCIITNTPTTGDITVNKVYTDSNNASVNITLVCDSGNIAPSATAPTVAGSVTFTVTDFTSGDTCTATEAVPPGYNEDEADCVGVAPGSNCTITNSPIRPIANFSVIKDFVPNSAAPVEVFITCNDGTPTASDSTITEGLANGHNFVVKLFTPGNLNCEITEAPIPPGYDDSYVAGDLGGDADSLGNSGGCQFNGVVGGDFTCVITNTAKDAVFEVNKVWEVIGSGGDLVSQDFRLGISCTEEILSVSPSPDFGPSWKQNRHLVKWLNLNGNTTVSVTVDSTNGTASCRARESIFDSAVVADNPCYDDRSLTRGQTTYCTIRNTVFFEGIPALNRYSLALLALLMLGVGAVGLRRFS